MGLNDIQAIDTMNRLLYIKPERLKSMFDVYEMQVMQRAVLKNVVKREGYNPEEAWRSLSPNGKSCTAEMVTEMDQIGVQYVCMDEGYWWSYREHRLIQNGTAEEILEVQKEAPGRVIGGSSYDCFRIRESLDRIERNTREYGFKYVWFHPISFGLPFNDRKCYPLYAKCSELGIPVMMQSGHGAEPIPSDPGHPMHADEVAIDFPELTMVLTHTGWPWIDEWMSMLWRHPNVYGNIGAYFPKSLDPRQVRFMDSSRGRDKVLWATNSFGLTRCKKEFMELPISDETKRMVLRDNALTVLKLEE